MLTANTLIMDGGKFCHCVRCKIKHWCGFFKF